MRDPACALVRNSVNCPVENLSVSMVVKFSFIHAAIGHEIRFAVSLTKSASLNPSVFEASPFIKEDKIKFK